MWRPLFTVTTALMIVGTSTVYAQDRSRSEDTQRWRPRAEDMKAFADARLAALKAGLQLKGDQEKNWAAFEQAARDFQRQRLDALNDNTPSRGLDPVQRMERRAATLSQRGAALKSLADATGPLYNSLDDGQKRRFAMLNPLSEPGDFGRRFRSFMRGHREWNRMHDFHRTDSDGADRAPSPALLRGPRPEPNQ
jgi:LTXXQ motif family protein